MEAEDYGWFSYEEFQQVLVALQKIQSSGSPTVLVGGQALVAWIRHYEIPIPDSGTPALTQDVDFLGAAQEAELLAKELGARCVAATIEDHTPETAVLRFNSPETGKILTVDFMGCLIGLDEKEVKRHAMSMEFEGFGTANIINPLLCIKSRFENLYHLSSKRNGNGVTQAQIAIEVIREFLKELLKQDNGIRLALKAIKKIRRIALSDAGIFVYLEYDIDILSAIEADLFNEKPKFAGVGWPHLNREVESKRQKRAKAFKSSSD